MGRLEENGLLLFCNCFFVLLKSKYFKVYAFVFITLFNYKVNYQYKNKAFVRKNQKLHPYADGNHH